MTIDLPADMGASCGNDVWLETEPKTVQRHFGPWWITLAGDELTDIVYDGTPVLRSIRAVARDAAWGTVPTMVVERTNRADGLTLRLAMAGLGAHIAVALDVEATDDALRVALCATMGTHFPSNRTGLVVLHDQRLAGTPLTVRDGRGGVVHTRFPEHIAPHQPATEIGALSWNTGDLDVSLEFSGAVFEMEDQRNWTDASFKTYSGRLSDPHPVHFEPGDTVDQSTVLRVVQRPGSGSRLTESGTAFDAARAGELRLEDTSALFPAIQLGACTGPDPVPLLPVTRAAALLVEIDAGSAAWRDAVTRARAEAGDLLLDVRIAAGAPAELAAVLAELPTWEPVERIGVVDRASHVTTRELWNVLKAATRAGTQHVAGTRGHFAQLNREIEHLPEDAEGLTFSVTPQVHAKERRQLVESILAQRVAASEALRLAAGRALDVGPVTLRPRITIDRPGECECRPDISAGYGAQFVPDSTDERMQAPALGAWVVSSAAALALPGVRSLTFFETSGSRGVSDADGADRPVAHAIDALHALGGLPLVLVDTGIPGVHAVAARGADGTVVLAANLTDSSQSTRLGDTVTTLAPYTAARYARGSWHPLPPASSR